MDDKIIDISSLIQQKKSEEVEKKIENYAATLSQMMILMESILDDIEDSGIDWFKAEPHQKDLIECISTLGLMMEVYAGWSRYC